MIPFTSKLVEVTMDPQPQDDGAGIAERLIQEPRGDFYALFDPRSPEALAASFVSPLWATPDNVRQFVAALGDLAIYFEGSEGRIRFRPLDSVASEHEFEKLLLALPAPHAHALADTIASVTADYTPTVWLEQLLNGPYMVKIDAATTAMINERLKEHERELIARGARPAAEHLAWRLGVPYGWKIG